MMATQNATEMLLDEIRRSPTMSREELLALLPIAQGPVDTPERRKAVEAIVRGNAKLTFKVAQHYARITKTLTLSDLILAGLEGIARSISTYRPEDGTFATYSHQWIRHLIGRAVHVVDRSIRIPVHMLEETRRAAKAAPTFDAAAAVWSRLPTASHIFDAPIGADGGDANASTVGDMLSSEPAEPDAGEAPEFTARADVQLEANERRRQLETLLAELPERLRFVIEFRADGATLEEIGAALNVSRERARQIEADAIYRMSQGARRRGWRATAPQPPKAWVTKAKAKVRAAAEASL